jgi:hypothetical protein
MNHRKFLIVLSIVAIVMSLGGLAPTSHPVLAAGPATAGNTAAKPLSTPTDTPDTLVSNGVTRYTIADPKVFWYTGVPSCPPPQGSSPQQTYPESISRIATYGGLVRTLMDRIVNCGQGDVYSNIIADGSYIYWMSVNLGGVARLSTSANVGDPPQLLTSAVSGYSELTQVGDQLYVLTESGTPSTLWQVDKNSGAATQLLADAGASPYNFQSDGGYLYWIVSGNLQEWDLYYGGAGTIANGVTGYYPEGWGVFYGTSISTIWYYSNYDSSYTLLYTSSTPNAYDYSMVADGTYLFFFEAQPYGCSPFQCYNDVLFRAGRDGTNATPLYVFGAGIDPPAHDLKGTGDFLFWQEVDRVMRLPKNAAGLPMINMSGSWLEITQGIQDVFNSVAMIQDRRTFVRFFANADTTPVSGVTAYLYATDAAGNVIDGPLTPVNPVGQQITVKPFPWRASLNDTFLFELPWSWLNGTLYLKAVVNPNHVPLEPNYGDNTTSVLGPFAFQPSPRLVVQFVSFGYVLNNQFYYPRLVQDIIQTYSWIRRAYPLASTPGLFDDPTPGFRPNLWFVGDDGLGARVNQTDPACTGMSDPSLCASAYTNNLLNALRAENGVPNNIFMYGLISDAAGFFPRGQASGNVSSGPAGSGDWGWDYDGSYADWYAGHEIGHTLGRGHPFPGSKQDDNVCGQDNGDDNYPYVDSQIGANTGSLEGFDVGDPGLNPNLTVKVYPSATWQGSAWHDVMSYCGTQWISDYTYQGMYDFMIAHPPLVERTASGGFAMPRIPGDFLSIYGSIFPSSTTAILDHVRHLSDVANIPPITPGAYSIRLIGSSGTLADYPFTPVAVPESSAPMLTFGQVVDFVAGTQQIQIVRLADNAVLSSKAVSANAPVVSNVQISGGSPVTGTVPLSWNATDADGDPLTLDILYSRDGGSTFMPFQMGVSGTSALIDTARLGGSTTAILRVVANDGANTGQGDTAPFTMQNKPPVPMILLPADGLHVHYGQLVNFSGQALDWQDGSVAAANLSWSSDAGSLGTGALLSFNDLPVGVNHITLTATNNEGLSASTSVTVYVDDDLALPGPTLVVAPTQVVRQVAPGAPAQTTLLGISNAGSGVITWTAGASAPWLGLDASSGGTPYSLTLTLDPTGYPAGTVLTTTLTIVSPATAGHATQTATVPVSLLVGNIWHQYENTIYRIYLPILLRAFSR